MNGMYCILTQPTQSYNLYCSRKERWLVGINYKKTHNFTQWVISRDGPSPPRALPSDETSVAR